MADIILKSLLNELTFRNQAAFDKYNSAHKLRNSTKVTINGKETTAGQAEKKTKNKQKPNDMFGGDYAKERGDKSSKKKDTTRKTGWKREAGAPYAEDDKFWNDRFLPGDKVAGDIASEEDFNMYRTAKIGISLNDWFGAKDKKNFNYDFEPTKNGNIIISSENGPVNFMMFSDDKNGSFNFGFTDNEDGEFIYENPDSTSSRDNGTFGGSNHFDDPQYVYQSMRYIMAQPETIQLLRGEITTREYKPMYEKFKKELESSKKTNENKMKNITLKSLLEAEDFQARSKETGKLVHFKSKDAYQAALKAGSHENPKANKGGEPKAAAKPNDMFGGDYAKDRGGEAPKADPVIAVASRAQMVPKAVAGWADKNGVDLSKVSDDLNSGKLNVFDFMTAVSGIPGNKYAKDIISKYSKSDSNTNYSQSVKQDIDGQTDDELYDALYDMGYDFGKFGSDDFDEEGFADAATNLGYRWDDKNKVWNHRDDMDDSDDSDVDGQDDEELYNALSDMGYDFGKFGSKNFDEKGFADAATNLGYRYDDKNKIWNHRDNVKESSTKLTSMIKNIKK